MTEQRIFHHEFLPRPAEAVADRDAALRQLDERGVRFLQLRFTDIFGAARGLEVPAPRFARALDAGSLFDGSALEGEGRATETEMLLRPDLATLRLLPWTGEGEPVASVVCEALRPDGSPYEGDPRAALRRATAAVEEAGLRARVGAEVEFFLLDGPPGAPPLEPASGGHLEVGPGTGAAARRDVAEALAATGVEISALQHDVAPGQHRIALAPASPLAAADGIALLRLCVRHVAAAHGLRAVFMPKPFARCNGSGLHFFHRLYRGEESAFSDPDAASGLSPALRHFVAGLLEHARGYCAITNPLVNSYKRLVPGFEAPIGVSWSLNNRAPLVRIPTARGAETACELRLPDAAANPYLALAVQLAAGLDGLRREAEPPDPIGKDLEGMTARERARLRVAPLPRDLGEALGELERDRVVRGALGEYVHSHYAAAKRAEWEAFREAVHPWEVERYLSV
jgi:glutamine synthetase